jgi:hypothetical protein
MSIIIAGVFADHVLIATDTYCVSLHGPYRFVSKAWPITHLPAVVTGRGTSGLITELATQAGVAGLDFDVLAPAFPEMIRNTAAKAGKELAQLPDSQHESEIFLAGWSSRASRPALNVYQFKHETDELVHTEYLPEEDGGQVGRREGIT